MKMGLFFKVVCLQSLLIVGHMLADQMNIVQIEGSDLRKEYSLFKRCWYSIYKNYSLKQLGFSCLSNLIDESFEQDEQDYVKKAPDRLFFHAIQDGQVVGYISFEIKQEKAVYVKHIALLPDVCTADSLRELIFVIFDYIDDVSCVHMVLHNLAGLYKELAAELGFVAIPQETNDMQIHLKLQFNKCGTCLCDFDYEHDDIEMSDYDYLEDQEGSDMPQSWQDLNQSGSLNQSSTNQDPEGFYSYFDEE